MKKFLKGVSIIAFFGVILKIGIYNYRNNVKFFEASFTSLVTIIVAVVVSFLFVQLKTDKRRQNEKIDELIYKIQGYITEESFVMGGEHSRKNLILHRSIINKIRYLKIRKIDKEITAELEKNRD